jgi:hypothetical protein
MCFSSASDQQAILRQANKEEFERYIGHAHMKLRKPMRDERAGKKAEAPAPPPTLSSTPATVAPSLPPRIHYRSEAGGNKPDGSDKIRNFDHVTLL